MIEQVALTAFAVVVGYVLGVVHMRRALRDALREIGHHVIFVRPRNGVER